MEARVSRQGLGLSLRIEIAYLADDRLVATCYGPNGEVLSQNETSADARGTELWSSTLLAPATESQKARIERTDLRDSVGNWTKKTILERGISAQDAVPVAEVYRFIAYY
jgi:hypothetical protein